MIFEIEDKPADPDGISYASNNEIRGLIQKEALENMEEFGDCRAWMDHISQLVKTELFIDFDQYDFVSSEAFETYLLANEFLNAILQRKSLRRRAGGFIPRYSPANPQAGVHKLAF